MTATARKISVLFYNAVHFGMAYHDPGAPAHQERHRTRVLANPQRRAKTFDFEWVPLPAAQAIAKEQPQMQATVNEPADGAITGLVAKLQGKVTISSLIDVSGPGASAFSAVVRVIAKGMRTCPVRT